MEALKLMELDMGWNDEEEAEIRKQKAEIRGQRAGSRDANK
jgi:hypothetical protein